MASRTINFESGTIPGDFVWNAQGAGSVVDDADTTAGLTKALRFPTITHDQTSYFEFTHNVENSGATVAVRYRTNSEENWDWFEFLLDSVEQFQDSGLSSVYEEQSGIALSVGTRTLRFQYVKDGTQSHGDDTTYISQIVITDEAGANQEIRATQLPILTVDLSNQALRLTQLPILIVAVEGQAVRITQEPLLLPVTLKPLPLPYPIVPEVPVTELWEWLTAATITANANEQRQGLRGDPRYIIDFNALILTEEQRREIYKLIYYYINKEFVYPLYQYSTKLTSSLATGNVNVFFDPAQTDMRVGESIAFFDPLLERTYYAEIATVNADGVTLTAGLDLDVPASWLVAPAPVWRFLGRPGLSMRSISGESTIRLATVRSRAVQRPNGGVLLPTVSGYPVIEKRPLAVRDVDEGFDHDMTWLDNDTSKVQGATSWRNPFVSGGRIFLLKKTDFDYWRTFADHCKGARKPFLLPTFRDDLPLVSQPALDATELVTTNLQYGRYFSAPANRFCYILTANGWKARRINDIVINYDANGDPENITLKLNSSIGNVVGDNIISRVSLMNLCRLKSDEIKITHRQFDALLQIEFTTVNR